MENVAINARKKFTMEKYFSQVKIVTPNNISKLFGFYARSVISSVEMVNNYFVVSGKIIANAVYLNDENEIENTETTVDFVEKQKANFVLSDLAFDDELEVQNINVSSSELMCTIAHKTKIIGIFRYLVGDASKAEDDLVLNKKTINCLNFKQSADENFVVVEELETNLKDVKVLNIDSNAILNSAVASVDKIVLDGRVKVNALYKDEDGIAELVKEFEFKQEVAMAGVLPGMNLDVCLKMLNTSITEQARDDKNRLVFVIDLNAKSLVFENTAIETYDDLFSLKNEIAPTYDFAEFEESDGETFELDTVLTQTDISSRLDFDDLVGVFEPKIRVVDIQDKGEKILISAEIKAIAIYKTQNSLEKIDLLYETNFEAEKDITKKVKDAKAYVSVSAFKVKAGKDLESAFQVEYVISYEKEYVEKFVKNFDRQKEKIDTDAGIKVYVTRENQSVFDVAKALNVNPDLITSQNEVSDYFEAGQKVFVYCPLNFA